jgi:hypothetical protein
MIAKADRERLRDFTIRPGEVRALADKLLDALDEAERERVTDDRYAAGWMQAEERAEPYRALVRELAKRPCEQPGWQEATGRLYMVAVPCGVCLTCHARALESGT